MQTKAGTLAERAEVVESQFRPQLKPRVTGRSRRQGERGALRVNGLRVSRARLRGAPKIYGGPERFGMGQGVLMSLLSEVHESYIA